ncbi:hypothetical protein AS034_20505 [[Bacillus] enclensis]|nr:hypothetical protein AS034_20505 [[Bacillus] enclensis]
MDWGKGCAKGTGVRTGVPSFDQKPGVAFGPGFSVQPDVRGTHLAGKNDDCLFWLGWRWVGDGDFDWSGVEGWGIGKWF